MRLISAAHGERLLLLLVVLLLLPPVAGHPRQCAWHWGLSQGGHLDTQEILILRGDGQRTADFAHGAASR